MHGCNAPEQRLPINQGRKGFADSKITVQVPITMVQYLLLLARKVYVGVNKGTFKRVSFKMKERLSKLTYPTLQHCLRMLYTTNGNSKN